MELSILVEQILKNTNNYYNGLPCVSDAVFDQWIEELRRLDPENSILHSVMIYQLVTCRSILI